MAKTILMVDDSITIRQMINFTLKSAGYTIIEAVDGQDGINKARAEHVDLIITDLNMPNKNGLELIRELRTDEGHQHTPILMLSTESDQTKKNEGKQAGATGWIVKPFNPEQLLKIISKVLPEEDAA